MFCVCFPGEEARLDLTLYLSNTSLFEKRFAKNAFNSEKINFDLKSDRFTKKFWSQNIYLSSKKLLKFWHFVSPRAPIPVTCF